jgi:hypothetical protein
MTVDYVLQKITKRFGRYLLVLGVGLLLIGAAYLARHAYIKSRARPAQAVQTPAQKTGPQPKQPAAAQAPPAVAAKDDGAPPKLTWVPVPTALNPTKAPHPRAVVKLSLDKALPDASFVVYCDRPCHAIFTSAVANSANYATYRQGEGHPEIAGFFIGQPNPFPADTYYYLGVESEDDRPIRVVNVQWFLPLNRTAGLRPRK